MSISPQNYLYKPCLVLRARELRKNSTLSEVLMWEKLKARQLLGYKFRRQFTIDKYIVDFYCKELNLAIEIDGLSHDYKMDYDAVRQNNLEKLGINFLRFNDLEVKQEIQNVIQRVVDWLNVCASLATTSPTPTPPKRGIDTASP